MLPQELFQGPYFCQTEHQDWFAWACSVDDDPGVAAITKVTKGRGTVVPVSFFERAGQAHYNSVAIVEDGEVLGVYRKSHIPDGPGYEEKFYFNPGDTGFKAWPTRHGTIGVGICWDQWFPESARVMALLGADDRSLSDGDRQRDRRSVGERHRDMWRRAMDGHAVCNHVRPRGREPGRHRGRAHVLRVVVHRRPPGPAARRGRSHERDDDHRGARPRGGSGRPRRLGPLPRSPPRPLRPAAHPGRPGARGRPLKARPRRGVPGVEQAVEVVFLVEDRAPLTDHVRRLRGSGTAPPRRVCSLGPALTGSSEQSVGAQADWAAG